MIIIKAAFALKEIGVFGVAASPQIFMRFIVFEKLDPPPPGKHSGSAPAKYFSSKFYHYFCLYFLRGLNVVLYFGVFLSVFL